MKYVFLLAVLSVTACSTDTAQRTEKPVYFDVAGYVKGQIETLSKQKPGVDKRTQMGDKVERQTTRTVNWSRELELFMQADINKPALRSSYAVARPDSLTYQYTLKPTEKNLTVRSLTVKLDSVTRQPRQIAAVLTTENSLYTSERQIVLESGPRPATNWGVTHYRMQGFQHLIVSDKNTFDVEGTVLPN
ncbi:hypothetical protein [Fibrivirga algicola]|uniref:LPS export ABC transporter periplasmic protein LptC n=1 Tax=Fibrivirga algicola TaxID=2950420 RepID=A0ABX0QN38_9BACT|nr:hypothetical protein [Fibrivirga algicola]ARK11317.1 hypothetical protein A6C57_13875 [Fibrella sp. ES10-3-2-2]NID13193.1 hypothetical protein [Fibrivirga algicola]